MKKKSIKQLFFSLVREVKKWWTYNRLVDKFNRLKPGMLEKIKKEIEGEQKCQNT